MSPSTSSSFSSSSLTLGFRFLLLCALSSLLLLLTLPAVSATANCSDVSIVEEGPYFVDGQAQLANVLGSELGIPLNLTLLILDGRNTSSNQCTPLANVKVDIWECDTEGVYSDESAENTLGQTYLRGYQLTNSSGYTAFQSLYPGWYAGRTPHIHFRLRAYDSAGTLTYDDFTQLFFNDSVTSYIYSNVYPYTLHPGRDTYNNASNVYTATNQLNLTGSYTAGYQSFVLLSIPLATTKETSNSGTSGGGASGGAGGGGAGGGGGPTTPTRSSSAAAAVSTRSTAGSATSTPAASVSSAAAAGAPGTSTAAAVAGGGSSAAAVADSAAAAAASTAAALTASGLAASSAEVGSAVSGWLMMAMLCVMALWMTLTL